MNLVLFLLSFLFASYAPTAQTTYNNTNDPGTVKKQDPGKGKGGKYGDGDYIIMNDIMP